MNITIEGLSREYRKGGKAPDQVSPDTGNGMFGLPGPNGAGRTKSG